MNRHDIQRAYLAKALDGLKQPNHVTPLPLWFWLAVLIATFVVGSLVCMSVMRLL